MNNFIIIFFIKIYNGNIEEFYFIGIISGILFRDDKKFYKIKIIKNNTGFEYRNHKSVSFKDKQVLSSDIQNLGGIYCI